MPAPLKDIAVDHLFNSSTDPRIFTLAAAGVDEGYKGDPSNVDINNSDYRKWLKSYGEDIKKQKETDKYMSLLAAGLGMMGGTSPYAAANIGDRKSTRLNSSHIPLSRMPSSA